VRLFVALEVPLEVRESLASLIRELRALAPRAKWVRPENLHVTLKFIGNVEPAKSDEIRTTLATVRAGQPVDVRFRGLGFFPSEKRPRVLWAGVEASANLAELAGAIDERTAALGIEPERRAFAPHLTLARFERPGVSRELQSAITAHASRNFGTLRTSTFQLIESKLKPSGAEYTTLQWFSFGAEG
jgi:RNA 2',3'-cyclic 3'-phosphodiesterase